MDASSDVAVSPLVTKVFEQEMLLDMILEYAIFEYNSGNERVRQKKWRRNAGIYRLVSNSWLQSTSRLLLKLNQPLLHFKLHDLKGGRVQRFVESVSGNPQLYPRVPPFTLRTTCRFSIETNHKRFLDVLAHCGSGLLELKLNLVENETWLRREENIKELPKLHSLTVSVGHAYPSFGATGKNIKDIQPILDASQQLKSFELSCAGHSNLGPNNNMNNLKLPSSLTCLSIRCEGGKCNVGELLKNAPPKLKSLQLSVNSTSFQNGALTCILEKVGKTLETFEVKGRAFPNRSKRPTTFRLPFMEKLKRLCIDTPYLKLEGQPSGLEQLVPNLSHVTLALQSASTFRKWGKSSSFESVRSLTASLVTGHVLNRNGTIPWTSFDVATMNSLKAAFPNLVELDIYFYADQLDSFAFATMMQLSKLKILKIGVVDNNEIESSDEFDALFLGIPQESVAALRNCPELWDDLPEDKRTTSIHNLTDLETLTLGSDYAGSSDFSFISDLSFKFAFLKMPRLTNLILEDPFFTTRLMAENWRKEGRNITIAVYDSDED